LFSGIGAYSKALKNLGIEAETVVAVEFDSKTMTCYNLIHQTNFEPSDITKLTGDELPDCDMICYSPPCQSFSVAGKNGGTADPRGTLFWDALRIIAAKKPKYAIMENVKNLTGKKHRETFDAMLSLLEVAGYINYWRVLNAKNYGTPQNRDRVFVVSIRKDIDQDFQWPLPFDNGSRLKDLLEPEVDEKYYISSEKCAKLLEELKLKHGNCIDPQGRLQKKLIPHEYSLVLRAQDHGNPPQVCVPVITPDILVKHQNGRRFKEDGDDSFTVTARDRHGVLVSNEIQMVGHIDLNGNDICKRVYSPEGISATIPTGSSGNTMPKVLLDYRIRKLTPLEAMRLMSFSDADYAVLHDNNISNSQIYKVAGNSIAVCVLEEIFKELLCPNVSK
jgi:DNA (cytosine-5)-methyltransferase 1